MTPNKDPVREAADALAEAAQKRQRLATAAAKASAALEAAIQEERAARAARDEAIRSDERTLTAIAKAAGISRTRAGQIRED